MQPDTLAQQIDDMFASTREGRHPGAAVLVVDHGQIVHRQGYGLADLEEGRPIGGDTSFYLCSLSKAFTAMAVMLLAEAGALAYDDPAARWLTALPARCQAITIRQLLHHTSGLPDYFQLSKRPDLAELTGFTNADVLRWVCDREALDAAPGERRQYSNAGYVLLATVVARVSGQPFHCFLRDRVFAPLDMRDTLVYDESMPTVPRLAPGYFPSDDGQYRRWDYNLRTAGGGGIFSTLDDLYRWDQALSTERLVTTATLRAAYTPGRLSDGTTFGYGFGWELSWFRGHRQLAHTGGLAAYHARFLRFPADRLTVLVLANTDRVDAVKSAEQVAGWVLAEVS